MRRWSASAPWPEDLAQRLNPAVTGQTARAARLCKADLVSGMVGEFPEVQGIMGREYALLEGEEAAVADAIAEHYLPIQAGGELPASDIGAFVSIADKLDTVCGCFSVGLIPTGAADPYALRRATIGIISTIIDKGYRLSLAALIAQALDLLAAKLTRPKEQVAADIGEFFRGRFVNLLANDYPADVIEAAVSAGFDDLVQVRARIAALTEFKSHPDFEPLTVAFKRVGNIIKEGLDAPVDPGLFQDSAENGLYGAFQTVKSSVGGSHQRRPMAGGPDRDRHLARPHRHLLRQGHGHGRGRTGTRQPPGPLNGHCQHVRTSCRFFPYCLGHQRRPPVTTRFCLSPESVKVSRIQASITPKGIQMIAIIDYGMGNLRSVQKGFEKVGTEAVVTADPRVVLEADKIVLPGVGAFRDCMRNLEAPALWNRSSRSSVRDAHFWASASACSFCSPTAPNSASTTAWG